MRYVSWATFYEGHSDALYLDVLIPRVIRDLVAREGSQLVEVPDVPAVKLGAKGRQVSRVAEEACDFSAAFDVVFIHADTGGRNLEHNISDRANSYCEAMTQLCNWPEDRCITITPRHETEAWLLADSAAVTSAFGYNGAPTELGLPGTAQAAERLPDPKQVLRSAMEAATGRRRSYGIDNLFPAIAQRQELLTLRHSNSFVQFEDKLRKCLRTLACIP